MFLVFSSTSSYILISEYMTIPINYHDPDYRIGQIYIEDKSRFWEIDIGNGFLSNIENILIGVFWLWSFMRFVDLLSLLEKKDKLNRWSYFWENIENL
jgi:hypothetical protein